MRRRVGTMLLAGAVAVSMALPALADGSQALGTPSVPIAGGTGFAVGGTGLADSGSGVISVSIPAGATVQQVLLYWEGQYIDPAGSDATATVGGAGVTGTLIGTSDHFPTADGMVKSDTYRADITALGLVAPGPNAVSVSGLDFEEVTDGAGILAIYDDGGLAATIGVRDGNDGAYAYFPAPRDATVPQTFTFDPAPVDRDVQIAMLVSSAADEFNGSTYRPNLVAVSGGVSTTFIDPFSDLDGAHWDSVILTVTVPAGAGTLTVEVVSPDNGYPNESYDRPASLFWNATGLSVPGYEPPGDSCTRTQGYWKTHSVHGPAPYDATWDLKDGGDALFFDSGTSYYETLVASSRGGNAYFILAQQYIAAEMNGLAGAAVSSEVAAAFDEAASLLETYSADQLIPRRTDDRTRALELSLILDRYNNGLLGVEHCD